MHALFLHSPLGICFWLLPVKCSELIGPLRLCYVLVTFLAETVAVYEHKLREQSKEVA